MSLNSIGRVARNAAERDRRPPPLGDEGLCRASGCRQQTSERKPYCCAHLSRLPYVQHVLEEVARREAEDELVRRNGGRRVDPDGVRAREILAHLDARGPQTCAQLAQALDVRFSLVSGYVRALQRAGRVGTTWTTTSRGREPLVVLREAVRDSREAVRHAS